MNKFANFLRILEEDICDKNESERIDFCFEECPFFYDTDIENGKRFYCEISNYLDKDGTSINKMKKAMFESLGIERVE